MEKLNLQGHKAGNLSFREIYDSIREIYFSMDNTPPKKAFIQKIATITKRSESAVRCWVAGVYQPDALAQEVIERELGIPASELFPKEDKVCAQ